MEYIIFIIGISLFVLFIIAKGVWDYRMEEKRFVRRLYTDYGKAPKREYKLERFVRLDSYFQKHTGDGQIDDITWNDLGMDDIFKRMNYTLSSTGEEYLYYILRRPQFSEQEMEHREEIIRYFAEQPDQRVKVQMLMRRLGGTGNYSLYDYLDFLDVLGERTNKKHLLLNFMFLPLLVASFFSLPTGLIGISILTIYNIVTYFKEKNEIDPYITSFAYVMRLLDTCDSLTKLTLPVCAQELETIRAYKLKFGRMKRGSFWILSGARMNASGNPLDVLMDYLRMTFHIDLIQFNKMLAELKLHIEDVDVLVGQVGYIESMIAIGAFRASLQEDWCLPRFTEGEELVIKEGYHPMLTQPVKNSIVTRRGVLLTGSNASGKSTFLKTVALNALLAQTIHTCPAQEYQAPFFTIYSSMSLRDDLESGESYYMVEIKALKRILDASKTSQARVLCFVDEVLRGTNTVERIAASSQILKSLADDRLLSFAATHDIELTELLKDDYDNYHFEEDVRDGDVFFNYKLLTGKATTRNAIRLLEIMGYDEGIIQKATRQAQRFVETGSWELT